MQAYQDSARAKPRGIGKRRCDRCHRWHKPLSASVRYCGACSARLIARAWQGLRA